MDAYIDENSFIGQNSYHPSPRNSYIDLRGKPLPCRGRQILADRTNLTSSLNGKINPSQIPTSWPIKFSNEHYSRAQTLNIAPLKYHKTFYRKIAPKSATASPILNTSTLVHSSNNRPFHLSCPESPLVGDLCPTSKQAKLPVDSTLQSQKLSPITSPASMLIKFYEGYYSQNEVHRNSVPPDHTKTRELESSVQSYVVHNSCSVWIESEHAPLNSLFYFYKFINSRAIYGMYLQPTVNDLYAKSDDEKRDTFFLTGVCRHFQVKVFRSIALESISMLDTKSSSNIYSESSSLPFPKTIIQSPVFSYNRQHSNNCKRMTYTFPAF